MSGLLPTLALVPFLASPVPVPPPDAATRGGYFLSVRFAENRSVPELAEAVDRMRKGALAFSPRDEPPPGFLLGHVSDVKLAVAFVSRWIFEHAVGPAPPGPPREIPAPRPGAPATEGALLHLLTLTITGSTPDGDLRAIDWPPFAGAILPPEIPWKAAGLTVSEAPLFAAPTATLLPVHLSHATVTRSGGLYALGALDRCDEDAQPRRCLRYEQVVARTGDDFRGGYLPAYLVAIHDDWTPAPDALPRVQLRPYAVHGEQAHFVLLARGQDGVLRQTTVTLPAPGGALPEASVLVQGHTAVVTAGAYRQQWTLDDTLDDTPGRGPLEPRVGREP